MILTDKLEGLLSKIVEAGIRKALPDLYSFVVENIYDNPHVLILAYMCLI